MKLTAKQERFALYCFQDLPQREAYIKAGYSSNMLPSTIDENASRLARKSKIVARITELRQQVVDKSIMDVTERKQVLTLIGRFGGKVAIPAIAELNKMDGSYAPEKHAILGKYEVEVEYTDRTKKIKDSTAIAPPRTT
jgi:hypothetical protein